MKWFRSSAFQSGAVVLLAAAWKLVLLSWNVVPFNADEAVVALMARHILQGERPVFFYGQAYMGSLDAFLVALGFGVFGQQVWVIRLVQTLLYLGTVLSTVWLGKAAFHSLKAGILAAGLLAFPTVNGVLYTTASLGGYGEALLLGNLILLLALTLTDKVKSSNGLRLPWLGFCGWGLLVGCGLWANGLTLVYSAPAGIYLLWHIWRCRRAWLAPFMVLGAGGFGLGSLPWWLYLAAQGPSQLIRELFGSAVAVEQSTWLVRTGDHLVNFLLLGLTVTFGLRPPWDVRWLALPLLPLIVLAWLGVMVWFASRLARSGSGRAEYALFGGVMACLVAGFLLTPFGVDPSGRYFLPLAVPLALIGAQAGLQVEQRFSNKPWLAPALVALVVTYQVWGTLDCARINPPGLTTQFYAPTQINHQADNALISFLSSAGETRGYTNYWVSYPLAFESGETLIYLPRLPYHLDLRYTPRDDRYAPYRELVGQSDRVAYITTRSPALDRYLRDHFFSAGITWQEKVIGDYQVFYHLSRPLRPAEIGLGELQE